MKTMRITIITLLFISLLLLTGCETSQNGTKRMETTSKTITDCNEVFVYASYTPVKINILPLTEYADVGSQSGGTGVEIYVSLSDSFGSHIKSPGTFRFELYERIPRSAEPKGKRIDYWPDIDLTDIAENETRWRDFLRAYEFNLPLESRISQNCILQATCICPNGKRLSAEYPLSQIK
jgi:hypothetical protein